MRIWDPSSEDRDDFLNILYDRYSDYLYKLAWELCSSPQDIDDLVQTVWVKLIAKEQILRTLSHPQKLNYISRTLRNLLREDARRKKLLVCTLESVDGFDSGYIDEINDSIDHEMKRRLFSEVWPTVNEDVRELLERKYDLKESDEEIARMMGIKVASVRMYLSRAKKTARNTLAIYRSQLF